METSRCRLCMNKTDFFVSLFGTFCRRTNMIDKILVCLKIVIEESDPLTTICYKCAYSVDNNYKHFTFVKKSQAKRKNNYFQAPKRKSVNVVGSPTNVVNRRVTSYVREQVLDADYTFSFLDTPEERKEVQSSPFFSYFSPPNGVPKQSNGSLWKTPRSVPEERKEPKPKRRRRSPNDCSRDLFESQSQTAEEDEPKSLDWKLTPDDNIIKRLKEKCFGRSEF